MPYDVLRRLKCGPTYKSTFLETIRSEDRPEVEIEEDMEAMEEGAKAGRMTKEENNRYSRLMQQANKKQRKQLKKMYRAGASLEQMIQMVSYGQQRTSRTDCSI